MRRGGRGEGWEGEGEGEGEGSASNCTDWSVFLLEILKDFKKINTEIECFG